MDITIMVCENISNVREKKAFLSAIEKKISNRRKRNSTHFSSVTWRYMILNYCIRRGFPETNDPMKINLISEKPSEKSSTELSPAIVDLPTDVLRKIYMMAIIMKRREELISYTYCEKMIRMEIGFINIFSEEREIWTENVDGNVFTVILKSKRYHRLLMQTDTVSISTSFLLSFDDKKHLVKRSFYFLNKTIYYDEFDGKYISTEISRPNKFEFSGPYGIKKYSPTHDELVMEEKLMKRVEKYVF